MQSFAKKEDTAQNGVPLKRPLRGSVAAALAVVAVLFELTHDGFRIDALTVHIQGIFVNK